MTKKTLDDILAEEDDSGLLSDLKPAVSQAGSEELRIRQKFNDINVFIDKNGHIPGQGSKDSKLFPAERMLQYALKGIRSNKETAAALATFDRHKLLAQESAEVPIPTSLEDILSSDDELLTTKVDDIFKFRAAPAPKARPDRKAERRPCQDFVQFKPLFDACVGDLKSGRRQTLEFKNEQEIKAGEFFILNGAMIFVAEVNDPHLRNGKPNARLRLIFDNGTEGDNLLRSLSAELYKDGPAGRGRRVTAGNDGPLFTGREDVEYRKPSGVDPSTDVQLEANDKVNGEIYILSSLSDNPAIQELEGHLFKIGFTTGNVQTRIAGAKDDPTFLLADVRIVKTYVVYNMSTLRLENLLHRFFSEAQLDIEIRDRFGKGCRPREWFLVSIETVDRAIEMMLDATILNHRYDRASGEIVRR